MPDYDKYFFFLWFFIGIAALAIDTKSFYQLCFFIIWGILMYNYGLKMAKKR